MSLKDEVLAVAEEVIQRKQELLESQKRLEEASARLSELLTKVPTGERRITSFDQGKETLTNRVVSYMTEQRKSQKTFTPMEVSKATGVEPDAVRTILYRLLRKKVKSAGYGKYQLIS